MYYYCVYVAQLQLLGGDADVGSGSSHIKRGTSRYF